MADNNSDIKLVDIPNDMHQSDSVESNSESEGTSGPQMVVDDDLVNLPFAEARGKALERFDRQFLSAALARHNGNIARTARTLGLHRQSLQKLMARRGIKSVRNPPSEVRMSA